MIQIDDFEVVFVKCRLLIMIWPQDGKVKDGPVKRFRNEYAGCRLPIYALKIKSHIFVAWILNVCNELWNKVPACFTLSY